MDCSLDLMRRLPPQRCEQNLMDLIEIAPDLCESLLNTIDQPLQVAKDKENGREYLLCDYNRDCDSYRFVNFIMVLKFILMLNFFYRSPWTNIYDPPLEDGVVPSDRLRKLEVEVNQAFDIYRNG